MEGLQPWHSTRCIHDLSAAYRSGDDTWYMVATFIPYMGSKRKLVPQLLDHVPRQYAVYHEPFLGSGALLYALEPACARASDRLPSLINLHSSVAVKDGQVIEEYKKLCTGDREQKFKATRVKYPDVSAAEFLFIMKNCHGARYRVNKAGKFNCPYKVSNASVVLEKTLDKDVRDMQAVAAYSKQGNVRFSVQDVFDALKEVKSGDLVFMDPPYKQKDGGEGDYGHVWGGTEWRKLLTAIRTLPQPNYIMLMLHGSMSQMDVENLVQGAAGLVHLYRLPIQGTSMRNGGVEARCEWLVTNYVT